MLSVEEGKDLGLFCVDQIIVILKLKAATHGTANQSPNLKVEYDCFYCNTIIDHQNYIIEYILINTLIPIPSILNTKV